MVEAVRTRSSFTALSASRRRGRSGPVWIVRADVAEDRPRVAFAVNRAVGTAVVRNRVRRRLRAAFTELDRAGALDPAAYLVGVRPAAAAIDYAALRDHCRQALPRP